MAWQNNYVDQELKFYYAYKRRANHLKLGYPQETIESRLLREGGVLIRSTAQPEFRKRDQEAEQTGRAVARLEKELRRVCDVAYGMVGSPESAKLKELNMCRSTYYFKLGQVHNAVLGYLNDVVAEG